MGTEGNGSQTPLQALGVRESLDLRLSEAQLARSLLELVVGQENGQGQEQSPPPEKPPTLVTLGYIPPDYLSKLVPPFLDSIRFSGDKLYLIEWVKRACQYPDPPILKKVNTFLSELREILREGGLLGFQEKAVFEFGRPYIPHAVIGIVKDGLWMIRKMVPDPASDLESEVSRQADLINAVAYVFGSTVRRVAQKELHGTVDGLRRTFIRSAGVADLKGTSGDGVEKMYDRIAAQLGDPLPLWRLPQNKLG